VDTRALARRRGGPAQRDVVGHERGERLVEVGDHAQPLDRALDGRGAIGGEHVPAPAPRFRGGAGQRQQGEQEHDERAPEDGHDEPRDQREQGGQERDIEGQRERHAHAQPQVRPEHLP
jgi:hypothetical protein